MVPGLLALTVAAGASAPLDVVAGQTLFQRAWVAAPSTTRSHEGLGPLYDARSCDACHSGGGPGLVSRDIGTGLLVRLGNADGGADPVYGKQLQSKAVPGTNPEAAMTITWTLFGANRIASLHIADLAYGPLDSQTHAAIRRAPSLRGAGALQSVSDETVLAGEARERREGLSGHAAHLTGDHGVHIGRWGWKAATDDLSEQVALAFQRDIGLSTTRHRNPWGECTPAETACRETAKKKGIDRIDAPDNVRSLIVGYVASLPSPRQLDENSSGFSVFRRIGCESCHSAALRSADGTNVPAFSDLLLHDMGSGLDDGIVEGDARSSEWRTPPLWDIAEELRAGGLLHDGRARNVAEAVFWHGGEASRARARYLALSSREKLVIERFLIGK